MRRVGLVAVVVAWGCGGELTDARDVETITLTAAPLAGGTLDVRLGAGRLDVHGDPGVTEVAVTAVVRTLLPESPKKDLNALEDLRFELVEDDGQLELVVQLSDAFTAWYVDVDVSMPPDMFVAVEDGAGDMFIQAVAGAVIDDLGGDIELEDVPGRVEIRDGSGGIFLSAVGDGVDIVDGSGAIEMIDVTGDVDVVDTSGSIQAERVQGHVEIDDTSGDIHLTEVTSARVADGSGDIHLDRVGGWELVRDEDGEVFER